MTQIKSETLRHIKSELTRARKDYPDKTNNLNTLEFFVGQLKSALAQHDARMSSALHVYSQAICVAVMAIRVAEEGAADFKYGDYLAPKPCIDRTCTHGGCPVCGEPG